MRVLVDPPGRLRDADPTEHLDRPAAGGRPADATLLDPVRLGDLPADGIVRMQGEERVLEDHRDLPTA